MPDVYDLKNFEISHEDMRKHGSLHGKALLTLTFGDDSTKVCPIDASIMHQILEELVLKYSAKAIDILNDKHLIPPPSQRV